MKVKKGTTGVTLVLQGLSLTCEDTAPVVCGKSTEVTIVAGANTENTLTDTENNNEETGNTQAENAVIKCKDGSQVILCGTGSLTIQANAKNGIHSGATTQEGGKASLTIRELTLNIGAANDAVNAEAALNVESGNLAISTGDDALRQHAEHRRGQYPGPHYCHFRLQRGPGGRRRQCLLRQGEYRLNRRLHQRRQSGSQRL